MYRLQAKLLALAIVASGAELGTNDRGLSKGLPLRDARQCLRGAGGARRHGNRRDSPRPHDPANQTRLLPLALQGLSEPHTGQVPLAPASRLGRQLLRLVGGSKIQDTFYVLLRYTSGSAAGFLVGDLVGF